MKVKPRLAAVAYCSACVLVAVGCLFVLGVYAIGVYLGCFAAGPAVATAFIIVAHASLVALEHFTYALLRRIWLRFGVLSIEEAEAFPGWSDGGWPEKWLEKVSETEGEK